MSRCKRCDKRTMICHSCDGTGSKLFYTCPHCDGTGQQCPEHEERWC